MSAFVVWGLKQCFSTATVHVYTIAHKNITITRESLGYIMLFTKLDCVYVCLFRFLSSTCFGNRYNGIMMLQSFCMFVTRFLHFQRDAGLHDNIFWEVFSLSETDTRSGTGPWR